MAKDEDSGSPGWTASASYIMQTTEDVVARAVAAAAAAATAHTSRPSVIFSSKDDNGNSQLQKLQKQVARVLKGFSSPPEVYRRAYNPEVLTSQKRQWASLQLQSLDQRPFKEPFKLFESMVVVGLHPRSDVHALQKGIYEENSDCPKRTEATLSSQQQIDGEPKLEPQVHGVEKTPSMSELNEILLGQLNLDSRVETKKKKKRVADDSTLYGCCMLVEEVVQKPSGLISMITEEQPVSSSLSRLVITTPRIFTEERLERLTKGVGMLSLFAPGDTDKDDGTHSKSANCSPKHDSLVDMQAGSLEMSEASEEVSPTERNMDNGSGHVHLDRVLHEVNAEAGGLMNKSESGGTEQISNGHDNLVDDCTRDKQIIEKRFPETLLPLLRCHQYESSESSSSTHCGSREGVSMYAVLAVFYQEAFSCDLNLRPLAAKAEILTVVPRPTLCCFSFWMKMLNIEEIYDECLSTVKLEGRGDAFVNFQGSPCEDRHCRIELDETEMEEASSSGQEDSNDHSDILEWAKSNKHGSLRIICEYYRLCCPARGATLTFHPLEHLHPLEFHRPAETVLHIAGSTIDLRSCSTSLEVAEAHGALLSEEEAVALSIWTVACICGNLRLEHVLTMFAGALLEKQILVVCSNLHLGLGNDKEEKEAKNHQKNPRQRKQLASDNKNEQEKFHVLPNDMLEFLDAPVPYVVGVKKQSSEIQSKLANVILIDANKNQHVGSAAKSFLKVDCFFPVIQPNSSQSCCML
ncbi:hypothetical protein ACLOJK_025374 [Asimina triloba]